jgi:hypothetical protein
MPAGLARFRRITGTAKSQTAENGFAVQTFLYPELCDQPRTRLAAPSQIRFDRRY